MAAMSASDSAISAGLLEESIELRYRIGSTEPYCIQSDETMSSDPAAAQAFILGAGLTPFVRPKKGGDYVDLAVEACRGALQDAGIELPEIGAAVTGYNYGEPTRCHDVSLI